MSTQPKKKKENPNKCEKCGGSTAAYADDYFIRKCTCYLRDALEADERWAYGDDGGEQ